MAADRVELDATSVTALAAALAAADVAAPGAGFFNITPSNTTDFADEARALWVGAEGDIAIVGPDDSVGTLLAVPAGTLLPFRAKRVNSTNTTASAIVGIV